MGPGARSSALTAGTDNPQRDPHSVSAVGASVLGNAAAQLRSDDAILGITIDDHGGSYATARLREERDMDHVARP
jgi:hypothetical protein